MPQWPEQELHRVPGPIVQGQDPGHPQITAAGDAHKGSLIPHFEIVHQQDLSSRHQGCGGLPQDLFAGRLVKAPGEEAVGDHHQIDRVIGKRNGRDAARCEDGFEGVGWQGAISPEHRCRGEVHRCDPCTLGGQVFGQPTKPAADISNPTEVVFAVCQAQVGKGFVFEHLSCPGAVAPWILAVAKLRFVLPRLLEARVGFGRKIESLAWR